MWSEYIIRTEEDKEKVIDAIRGLVGEWAIYKKPLLPKATPDQFEYLFGVVYEYIADYCGYTNVHEVHRGSMEYYNLKYDLFEFFCHSCKAFFNIADKRN